MRVYWKKPEVPDCDHSKITRDDTYADNGSFYRCKKCHQIVEKELSEKEVPDWNPREEWDRYPVGPTRTFKDDLKVSEEWVDRLLTAYEGRGKELEDLRVENEYHIKSHYEFSDYCNELKEEIEELRKKAKCWDEFKALIDTHDHGLIIDHRTTEGLEKKHGVVEDKIHPCKCGNKKGMERQWVCERCGNREVVE